MPQFFPSIPPNLEEWVLKQQVFFTATAPLHGRHINVSPKGLPASTFTIFDPNHAAYIDATGSGSETISHVYENGRITIMFCSFETAPRIVRFFCNGRVVEYDSPEYMPLLEKMGKEEVVGARAVILLHVFKVINASKGKAVDVVNTLWLILFRSINQQAQSSCGYGVPLLKLMTKDEEAGPTPYFQDRKTLGHFAEKKVESRAMKEYQMEWNASSLDGLNGLRAARRDAGERLWVGDCRTWMRRRFGSERQAFSVAVLASLWTVLVMWLLGLVAIR